jgi:Fur family ferric uptake transcriptional regulator
MTEHRATTQRGAIRDALRAAAGPLLPEEILAAARDSCPTLGQATVYRALRRLEEAGEVQRVNIGDGRPRYEATRAHHHHFHCRKCERVYDIDGCMRAPASLGQNLPDGFELEGHEVVLFGVCSDCG